jgi:acetyltransferase-like isoleucine patch superfamily enzyme
MIKKYLKNIYFAMCQIFPYGRIVRETYCTQTPIKWRYILWQKILGFNRHAYWPVHFTSMVGNAKNITCGIETCPGYMPGCYIQGGGKVAIGDYTQIAANVGMITRNHDVYENQKHESAYPITIGAYGWIGMNSVILPDVELGDFTIVGAGSVVTKSFKDGYCVIAGNPAKIIRHLDRDKCVRFKSSYEYNGYIPSDKFADFCNRKGINK